MELKYNIPPPNALPYFRGNRGIGGDDHSMDVGWDRVTADTNNPGRTGTGLRPDNINDIRKYSIRNPNLNSTMEIIQDDYAKNHYEDPSKQGAYAYLDGTGLKELPGSTEETQFKAEEARIEQLINQLNPRRVRVPGGYFRQGEELLPGGNGSTTMLIPSRDDNEKISPLLDLKVFIDGGGLVAVNPETYNEDIYDRRTSNPFPAPKDVGGLTADLSGLQKPVTMNSKENKVENFNAIEKLIFGFSDADDTQEKFVADGRKVAPDQVIATEQSHLNILQDGHKKKYIKKTYTDREGRYTKATTQNQTNAAIGPTYAQNHYTQGTNIPGGYSQNAVGGANSSLVNFQKYTPKRSEDQTLQHSTPHYYGPSYTVDPRVITRGTNKYQFRAQEGVGGYETGGAYPHYTPDRTSQRNFQETRSLPGMEQGQGPLLQYLQDQERRKESQGMNLYGPLYYPQATETPYTFNEREQRDHYPALYNYGNPANNNSVFA